MMPRYLPFNPANFPQRQGDYDDKPPTIAPVEYHRPPSAPVPIDWSLEAEPLYCDDVPTVNANNAWPTKSTPITVQYRTPKTVRHRTCRSTNPDRYYEGVNLGPPAGSRPVPTRKPPPPTFAVVSGYPEPRDGAPISDYKIATVYAKRNGNASWPGPWTTKIFTYASSRKHTCLPLRFNDGTPTTFFLHLGSYKPVTDAESWEWEPA